MTYAWKFISIALHTHTHTPVPTIHTSVETGSGQPGHVLSRSSGSDPL